MVQNRTHGFHQGVLPLGDGIHKPLGRIHLLLHKCQGLLRRLVLLASLRIRVHHLFVGGADAQIRRIAAIELKGHVLPFHRQQKVGNDMVDRARGLTSGIAWFGVESCQFLHRIPQLIFPQIQRQLHFGKVLLHEGVVMRGQNRRRSGKRHLPGIAVGLFVLFPRHLQQKTLLQVTRSHSCRVQGLNETEGFFEGLLLHLNALGEGQIVHNALQVAAQIAVVVQVSNQMFGQRPGRRSGFQQGELVGEQFPESRATPQWNVLVLHIRALVSCSELIIWGFIVQVLLKIKLLQGLGSLFLAVVQVVQLFSLGPFLKGGVGLQFLLDPRFEFQGRNLKQLHQLNLLRRELLEKFLLETLFEHGLKFGVLRGSREGNHISDVGHSSDVHHQPFKTHAKSTMRCCPKLPGLQIPPDVFFRNVEFCALFLQDVQTLLALAASDDFSNPRDQDIHGCDRFAVVIGTHVEGLDARRIIGDNHGTPHVFLHQPTLMLTLKVDPPLHWKFELLLLVRLGIPEDVDHLGVGQVGEWSLDHGLQPFRQGRVVPLRLGQLLFSIQFPFFEKGQILGAIRQHVP